MAFLQSDIYLTVSNFISFIANICILFMTAYTLYLTAFSRKISFVSMGCSFSMFHGNTIHLNLKNRSLHAIPVMKIFLMKKTGGMFHYICLATYEEPLMMNSWHICKIQTEPFTEILGLEKPDGSSGISDIYMDAMIGVDTGDTVIWVKPYKRAPFWSAKRAYKKFQFDNLTVVKNGCDGKILSKAVNYIIRLVSMDLNGQKEIKTIFAIAGSDGGILSEAICGQNAIDKKYCKSAAKLKHHLCKQFRIPENHIDVQEYRHIENIL